MIDNIYPEDWQQTRVFTQNLEIPKGVFKK
jgi:hypothetical protein